MLGDDKSYFQHRAEVEMEHARQSALPCAAKAHHQLAKAYLERLASLHFADETVASPNSQNCQS